jgi:AraC-like DNA-binding protein
MSVHATPFTVLATVADFARHYGFAPPAHPLVAVVDLADYPRPTQPAQPVLRQLYALVLKRHFHGQLAYGQQYSDYRQGELSGYAPGQPVQLCSATPAEAAVGPPQGWMVVFHPDLLPPHPGGPFPGSYPLFAYRVQQALALSASDAHLLHHAVAGLQLASALPADALGLALLRTQLDVLLQAANRVYYRQFAQPPASSPDLLSRFESQLTAYLASATEQPLPTVQQFAEALHVSPAHLGNVLRTHTGLSAQEHLHAALLEKAKQQLLGTAHSIREVAFSLGFEHPSYFTRLFKQKTGFTPASFRQAAWPARPTQELAALAK